MFDRRHTILIVDDEPDILQSLELTLESDYDVLTANSGTEGLDLLEKNDVSLVISDQRMPKMMGVEFLERSQTISPNCIRMMLTGYADIEAIIQAINSGRIYRYITKPWEPRDLEMDVRRGIESFTLKTSLDHRMQELTALCEIGSVITSSLDLDQVMKRILDGIVDTLGFERSFLMLVDEDRQTLRHRGCSGVSEEVLPVVSQIEYRLDQEELAPVLTLLQNRSILVENVNTPPVGVDKVLMRRIGIQSFVTAPLCVGGKGIGVLMAERTSGGQRFGEHDRRLLSGFAAQAAIAVENARLYGEAVEKQRLEKEVAVAVRIQQHLLPETLPVVAGFDIAGTSRLSRGVGGDYYDVLEDHTGRLWIALGDVTGKGVPAALTMATLRTLFRVELEREQSLAEVLSRVGDGLGRCTPPEVFATFCCGILNPTDGGFTVVNAAHPCPVVVRADGSVTELTGAGPPTGLDPFLAGTVTYEEQTTTLNSGDLFLLYSDGVSEALNDQNDLFGEKRLTELVAAHRDETAAGILESILHTVSAFQGSVPQSDDITLVVVKRVP